MLSSLKQEGKIQYAGIATRTEDTALAAINSNFFETIQLAYSILDQRMENVLVEAQKNNVGIINRSVLLQGALTPKYEHLPDALAPVKKAAEQATNMAEEIDTSLPDMAIRFVLENSAVSTALIGTSKPHQIESAITASEKELPEETINSLYKLAINDPDQVDPSRWPNDTQTI